MTYGSRPSIGGRQGDGRGLVGGAAIQFGLKDGFPHFSTWVNGLTSFEHTFYGCNISLSALQARRLCGWDREGGSSVLCCYCCCY